jgi:hypothetical protein
MRNVIACNCEGEAAKTGLHADQIGGDAHTDECAVLAFQPTADEQADEFLLADVFARQRALADGYEGMAENLYRLRALWIGGMCLPWGVLTDGQRAGYVAEIKTLVKGGK